MSFENNRERFEYQIFEVCQEIHSSLDGEQAVLLHELLEMGEWLDKRYRDWQPSDKPFDRAVYGLVHQALEEFDEYLTKLAREHHAETRKLAREYHAEVSRSKESSR